MKRVGRALGWVVLALAAAAAPLVFAQTWTKMKDDGLHDPKSPAFKLKQEPGDALGEIARKAPDVGVGNQVRWVKALESGAISPRTNLWPDTQIRVLDQDIYLDIGGSQGVVRFPHKQHTLWLDCSNCHDQLFSSVAGTTDISMLRILEGEQCGVCHGAVAFPLTECVRCHSVSQADFPAIEKKLGLTRVGAKGRVAR
jgi:c(7)-type cytochrome triheme protein